ncbi:Protein csh3 [Schizosaccharomyces pombe]|uniref:Protein csh3 n=1 Tax=Schizosaccharomyces pombe (strain 972 / ATCC 24843) TaxID=284812 RepID=CSH3_SCHPO|nr:SH3 domain-containing protein [Schizosaccharomyces pombe]O43125.1 RecName: Full=Protein csh3 [Schizosaccharomyces pombe 972h-]BAA25107.1 CSH3 [Schizosaccharomyces pombe]CAA17920.1 Wiskott-Aldrich syndrome homolog binding protein Lsb1 (predicted) [Schizosaccharomyces pombe]|eukprot:NP_595286.1 SH3 domain-containing protein [Schizosaccharomyces pombe]
MDHKNYLNHVIRGIYNDFQFLVDEGVVERSALDWVHANIHLQDGPASPVTAPAAQPVESSVPLPLPKRKSSVEKRAGSVASAVAAMSLSQNSGEKRTPEEPRKLPGVPAPQKQSEASSVNSSTEKLPPPPSYPGPNTAHKNVERVLAMYDFPGPDAGDLGFHAGEVIIVLEHVNNDWWRGELNGKEGIFPSNYVRLLEDSAVKAQPPPPPPQQNYPPAASSSAPPMQYQQTAYPPQQAPYPPVQAYPQAPQQPIVVAQPTEHKHSSTFKKIGSGLGSAFVFGAGATAGADLVNSIF